LSCRQSRSAATSARQRIGDLFERAHLGIDAEPDLGEGGHQHQGGSEQVAGCEPPERAGLE